MANCPKCNHHLRLIDWKQKCPYCGANVVIYDQQERLMQDADKAEVQYYHFQKKIDRLKASYVGSKLAITRIVTSLLPIAALFLPIVKGTITKPFEQFEGSMDVIKFYESVTKLDFGALFGLISQPETKMAGICFAVGLVGFVLSVVAWLVHFICIALSCSPKGKPRNYTLNAIMLVSLVVAIVAMLIAPANSVYSLSVGFGAYLFAVLIIVNVVIDVATFVKGIEVKHKQCYVGGIPIEEYFKMQEDGVPQAEIRQEMYRRLQEEYDKKIAELEKEENKSKEEVEA